ncbi:unnamed protein product [Durusdinium trenchii]|uniref:Uncharacterized protein n=1 Tax=Durusdinium trenchii TaxID=1381693 RepID=A0ABP0H7G4_9DINO
MRMRGNLGDQGAEHLAEALAENEVLTSLSLEGNRVSGGRAVEGRWEWCKSK